MRRTQKAAFLFILLSVGFNLSACGGSSSSSGNPSSPSDFISLLEFKVTPISLTDGEAANIEWETLYQSPSSIYTFDLHLTNDPAAISSTTQIFSLNCGLPSHSCSTIGESRCTYSTPAGGQTTLTCNQAGKEIGKKTNIPTGTVTAVGEACIFDSSLKRICNTKTIEITLN